MLIKVFWELNKMSIMTIIGNNVEANVIVKYETFSYF